MSTPRFLVIVSSIIGVSSLLVMANCVAKREVASPDPVATTPVVPIPAPVPVVAPVIAAKPPVSDVGALMVSIRNDARLTKQRDAFMVEARTIAALPLVRRPYTYAEVGKPTRSWMDGRAIALHADHEPSRDTFALSLADFTSCQNLSNELPMLATAFGLTGDEAIKQRILSQLDELASWSPLQRPGWQLVRKGDRLPADGKHGSWLGTGLGVRAIVDTLELLPRDVVSADLRARLEKLLAAEIDQVVDDWKSKRQWFVKSNNPITNQWVLPTEGLITACLFLGVDRHREAYELGVANMMMSFDVHGVDGEFEEGFNYAAMTVRSFIATARAMASHGDDRLLKHTYLQRFPTWLVHHLQPGGYLINAFDCYWSQAAQNPDFPRLLADLAVYTHSPVAHWALMRTFKRSPASPSELLAHGLPAPTDDMAPPLFAAYPRATRVNWRSGWDDAASGAWIRGGHSTDQHDNVDRGHVNFIVAGKPILIESGTPVYHHPHGAKFYSAMGHNILQLGDGQPSKSPAPITVHRLDAAGGDITVDVSACYAPKATWVRRVTWTATNMTVVDTVERTTADASTTPLFRWKLGTSDPVTIASDAAKPGASWPDATITIDCTEPLTLTQERLPDHTMDVFKPWNGPQDDHLHTCLVVTAPATVATLTITTRIAATVK
jgi:hypothetical protein